MLIKNILKVKKILKKTKAKFFQDVAEGDVIFLYIDTKSQIYNHYVPKVQLENLSSNLKGEHSLLTIGNYISNFETEEVNENLDYLRHAL